MYSNLAKLRKEQQVTQEKLGKLIGCTASNFSRRERGTIPFRIDEMEIIQKFFDKPLDEIFLKYKSN